MKNNIKGYDKAISYIKDSVGMVYNISMPRLSNPSEMMSLNSGAIKSIEEGTHGFQVILKRRDNKEEFETFTFDRISQMNLDERNGQIRIVYKDNSYFVITIY